MKTNLKIEIKTPDSDGKSIAKSTSKSEANSTSKSTDKSSDKSESQLTVIFCVQKSSDTENDNKKEKSKPKFKNISSDILARLESSIQSQTITGKSSELTFFRDFHFQNTSHLLVYGLGDEKKLTHESIRSSLASVYSAAKTYKMKQLHIQFDSIPATPSQSDAFLKACLEGLQLAAYNHDEFFSNNSKSGKPESSPELIQLLTKTSPAKQKILEQSQIICEAVNFARQMGDTPGNLMTPEILAQRAVAGAQDCPHLKVTVWDKTRIKKEKMGGLMGVSLGSEQEPRFIIMEYTGGAKSKAPVALVGKGLTFDSGGISIKPSAAMEEMKYDMCGGAAVIATMIAISKLKLKVNVVGLIPATENMPGPGATKPGDILFARNGKSIEVNNTDAEGRLILADALSYASELKPQAIFDVATLTGAMVISLGNIHTGFFTKNNPLKKRIETAADSTGELVWQMPFVDHHSKDMKGTFADLSNVSSSKGAGSATAAAFLQNFVTEDIPWAHFDIAGTGWAVGSRLNYCTKKGASGVLVRTFVELIKSYL